MKAIQPHLYPLEDHGVQYDQTQLYHSQRMPLGQKQIILRRRKSNSSSHTHMKNTDECRRNRYYRTDRGDQHSTSTQATNSAFNKQTTSNLVEKTTDEILCDLFVEKNIDLRHSRKIGCGRYSRVIMANYISNGHPVAIKMINTLKVTEEFRNKFLPREIDCWKRLDHPHLVKILGHYEAMDYVYLTMEFARGGDMLQHVQKKGPVKEDQAMIWMAQVISAVHYMHARGIVHRDLKLENIVIFPDEGIIKISDFGFARSVSRGDALSETYCGSKSYSAPEILKGEPYDPYKSDVWSVGVIAFVMVTDCMPYSEKRPNPQIVEAQWLRAYEYPSKLRLSEKCRFSIDTMMTFSWKDRPRISQCGRLPWFQTSLPRIAHTLKPKFCW